MPNEPAERLVRILYHTTVELVRRAGPDLTARQMAVLLASFLHREPQTIRGLATILNVPRPSVTRTVDRLEELNLLKRRRDRRDRRSVLVQRHAQGQDYFTGLKSILEDAACCVDRP